MGCPIRPSNVRVYQFHHDGNENYFAGTGLAGTAGLGAAGGACFGAAAEVFGVTFSITDGRWCLCRTVSRRERTIKPMKAPVVSL